MTESELHTQERTARELLTQQPLFVGTADEVAVYWDGYERTFAVVTEDGDATTVPLAETPFDTPAQYCEHVRDERGWDVGPRIGGSIVDDLKRALA
ncbi:hypothetical protein DVK00_14765 [Haloarcula sp. Atlit-47R]|uniref:hypothetical protein n=1 Tax=Haloarcula sp. Atlit-47R TaxID=2282132 RepID=UPI000EF27AE5|nr:hypothetical protein [Haloarcula sp. Atlit-47R]RLM42336.1 hypothetical protein DVK00_14765 [Haloarcula sp. Atlit-47R]